VLRIGLGPEADYRIGRVRWDLRRAELDLGTPSGGLSLETRLPGFHNARNVAAVAALADLCGCDRSSLAETLARHPGALGRFEHVDADGRRDLILDLASSAAAVEQFLIAARGGMRPGARLHTVLGVLGVPEAPQRRATGRVARRLCDRLVLTAGSFRPRPPTRTLEPMIAGATSVTGADLSVVAERERAIDAALREARPGDVVAILGRGNLVEAVTDRKVDDRSVLYRAVRRQWLGPDPTPPPPDPPTSGAARGLATSAE
jgi:UDP-N-acetylmuramoyl-L-alanyl-D-glutamate--2,6-diaminopimelate ligase